MLDKVNQVLYQALPGGEWKETRLLLFDQSIQLYDTEGEAFMGAYALNEVKLHNGDAQFAELHLLPGKNEKLLVSRSHLLWPELEQKLIRKKKANTGTGFRWKWPLLVAGIIGLLIGIYFVLIAVISSVGMYLVSVEKEQELGEMIYSSMVQEADEDVAASSALTAFADELSLSQNYNLKFTVVNDTLVNAFAIPGGHIVVYKGILNGMKDADELVALLSHEASHVNERHSLRSMLRAMSGSLILSMVFGDMGSIGGALVSQADQLRNLSYSRSLEEQADEEGMELMIKNKIDPKGMVKLMDQLAQLDASNRIPGFLSTHPLTADRRVAALAFVTKHPTQPELPVELKGKFIALKETISVKDDW